MAGAPLQAVLEHVRGMAGVPHAEVRSDAALLRAFATADDQAAFGLVVGRHASMVLAVCRRVLHHQHDAEDAFQATFLLLARHAGSLGQHESAAGWLHAAAFRLACNARRSRSRRRLHEGRATALRVAGPEWEVLWREVQIVLDEEVQRLPVVYRDAFVLCCLENQGAAEAARVLGVEEGTVRSRLARARARLQKALRRRGVSLSAVLTAAALVPGTVRASEVLVAAAVQAAGAPGAVPASVAELLPKAKTTMLIKIKATTLVLLALALAGAGAGMGQPAGTTVLPEQTPARKTDKKPMAKEVIQIRGVVRDRETRKPLAGVSVGVAGLGDNYFDEPRWKAVTDKKGRYELRGLARSASYELAVKPPAGLLYFERRAQFKDTPGAAALTADIEMVQGLTVRGKVVDQDTGKPIAQARVEYVPVYPNRHINAKIAGSWCPRSEATTAADGTYTLTVLPGQGFLGVTGPKAKAYLAAAVALWQIREAFKVAYLQLSYEDRPILAYAVISEEMHNVGNVTRPLVLGSAIGDNAMGKAVRTSRYHGVVLIDPGPKEKTLVKNVVLERAGR